MPSTAVVRVATALGAPIRGYMRRRGRGRTTATAEVAAVTRPELQWRKRQQQPQRRQGGGEGGFTIGYTLFVPALIATAARVMRQPASDRGRRSPTSQLLRNGAA